MKIHRNNWKSPFFLFEKEIKKIFLDELNLLMKKESN